MSLLEHIISESPKVISFDFDDTLSMSNYIPKEDGSHRDEEPERIMPAEIKNILMKIKEDLPDVIIHMVTSREDSSENREEVRKFLEKNKVLQYFSGLHFVGGDKALKLIDLNSEFHFDDNKREFEELNKIPNNVGQVHLEYKNKPEEKRIPHIKKINSLKLFFKKNNMHEELKYLERIIKYEF